MKALLGTSLKAQGRIDEFAFIILGVVILMGILVFAFNTPSEFPAKVSPSSVSLTVEMGESKNFDLNISGAITEANITVQGSVAGWVRFSKDSFGVLRGFEIVTGTVSVPESAALGVHRGTILLLSKGGKVEVPISVEVTVKQLVSRNVQLGSFVVSYSAGTNVLDSKENAVVSKGYFSEKNVNLIGVVGEDELQILTSATLQLLVDDTNSYGNLRVYLNDELIFNERVGPGEVLIPIETRQIQKSNVITIKADNPGFFFWAQTVYNLRIAKFTINFRGAFSKSFEFTMSPEEVAKFDHFQLSYRVGDFSTPLPDMKIAVNEQTVFNRRPEVRFASRSFGSDVFNRPLVLSGKNTIAFTFESEAFYDIRDAVLTIFVRV